MKIILDTNVFISGVFLTGPPYQILSASRPELDTLLEQTHTWERQYNEATKTVTRMRRILGGLESSRSNTPKNLNLTEFHRQVEGLNIIKHADAGLRTRQGPALRSTSSWGTSAVTVA